MQSKTLYDISEVCRMLGTTSRTLRFYEEKGIVESTTVGLSSRRQYTGEQIDQIRNVLLLRTLGLSVKAIAQLQAKEGDLKEVVLSKRAEIYASIEGRLREIHLLNEALSALEAGKNLFGEEWQHPTSPSAAERAIARTCTEAIVSGDSAALYPYLSARLVRYMPENVYATVRQDTLAPLGEFLGVDAIVTDGDFPNKIYAYVRYARLGLRVTFVFHNGEIDGLWLGYYDTDTIET